MEAAYEHTAKVLLSKVTASPTAVQWADHATKDEAFTLHRKATGQKLRGNCLSCHFTVVNWLRSIVGEPPINDEAPGHLHRHRLSICRGLQEDGSDACEHLAWPGLNCGLCGCFVDVKARFKRFKCPAGKW